MRWFHVPGFVLALAGVFLAGASAAGPIDVDLQPSRLKTIHVFDELEGTSSFSRLVLGWDGRLYGLASWGGPLKAGTFFRTSIHGHVVVQHAFSPTEISSPRSLVLGADGNFYGIGSLGGMWRQVLFRLTPHGKLTVIYTGVPDGSDCFTTNGPFNLMRAGDGYLYVVNGSPPNDYNGCIAQVSLQGQVSVRHWFTEEEGVLPEDLVEGRDGNLYGTTSAKGRYNGGSVYRMDRDGAVTVIHQFTRLEDGNFPHGLVVATDGFLYGLTYGGSKGFGTVFRMSTQGDYTRLHDFDARPDGRSPRTLMQAKDGMLYGFAGDDSPHGAGAVFRISLDGAFEVVHAFDWGAGEHPGYRPLTEVQDGHFYWAASENLQYRAYQLRLAP